VDGRGGALRAEILRLVGEYWAEAFPQKPFHPGGDDVPVSGKVFGPEELMGAVEAALDGWWTAGPVSARFERRLAEVLGIRHVSLTNSGSSANLLAVSALTAPELGDRRLLPGQEVLTSATSFPTTVNPILQNGLVPVFIDVEPDTYNVDPALLAAAVGPATRAVVLAHTLGNPFDLDAVLSVAKANGLWVVEDACDALGARYRGRPVGTFGDLATFSFYPAHHITTGEGGAVATRRGLLKVLVESFRDWGRACWCDPGRDNTCGQRFGWRLGALPAGYDHKYTYSHIGYNLKTTDFQSAVGLAQIERLGDFAGARRANFARLAAGLAEHGDLFLLPRSLPLAEPSWFGFPLTVRADAPFQRRELIAFLEGRRIRTRLVFAGNALRQPAYAGIPHRRVGSLENADGVLERALWIGLYPGVSEDMVDYVLESVRQFRRGL